MPPYVLPCKWQKTKRPFHLHGHQLPYPTNASAVSLRKYNILRKHLVQGVKCAPPTLSEKGQSLRRKNHKKRVAVFHIFGDRCDLVSSS